MHVDDLTFLNAAQLLAGDNLYIGRPSDPSDPDKRTDIAELTTRIISQDFDAHISGVISGPNGSYFRVGDLQVCWFEDSETTTATNATGGVYYAAAKSYGFPAGFVEPPLVLPKARRAGSGVMVWAVEQGRTSNSVSLYAVASTASTPGYLGYVAVGRWR